MAALLAILYACVVITVTIYIIVLISRFVNSHERIARALERMAESQRRDPP